MNKSASESNLTSLRLHVAMYNLGLTSSEMEVCNPLIGLSLSKLVNHFEVILLNLCNLLKAFLNQRIKMPIILDECLVRN